MAPAGSQDLSHVMGNSSLVGGGSGSQEITLTINNSSLTQALAQVQAQASASGSSGAGGTPQEITLTISGMKIRLMHPHFTNSKQTKNVPHLSDWHTGRERNILREPLVLNQLSDIGRSVMIPTVPLNCVSKFISSMPLRLMSTFHHHAQFWIFTETPRVQTDCRVPLSALWTLQLQASHKYAMCIWHSVDTFFSSLRLSTKYTTTSQHILF